MYSSGKSLAIIFSILMLAGFSSAYIASGDTAYATVDTPDYGDIFGLSNINNAGGNYPHPEVPKTECNNKKDDNGLYGRGYHAETWDNDDDYVRDGRGDPGCVSPWDDTESSLWDSDLTATLEKHGNFPETYNPSVYFDGAISVGHDITGEIDGKQAQVTVRDLSGVERSLKGVGVQSGQGKYSKSGLDLSGKTLDKASRIKIEDSLPDQIGGIVQTAGGKVIDGPVDPSRIQGQEIGTVETCGNGYRDEGDPSVSEIRPEVGDNPSISCRSDAGSLGPRREKLRGDSWNLKEQDFSYERTVGFCPPSFPKSPSGQRFTADGDFVDRHYWGSTESSCTPAGSDEEEFYDVPEKRLQNKYYNCNRENIVNGGGRDADRMARNSVPGNDPAATYTDMSAYEDGTSSKVRCQAESTLTVDADGPKGFGDGFVVIKNGEKVMGRYSPETENGRTDQVGRRAHYREDGGSFKPIQEDFVQARKGEGFRLECGDKDVKYCVKYLDFYTSSQSKHWSPTSSGSDPRHKKWDGGTRPLRESPVRVKAISFNDKKFLTPDQSYSVCKFINKVGAGKGKELLDCDYEAEIAGHSGDMSPLNAGACGNKKTESLVTMEGKQVNFDALSQQLFLVEACMNYGQDAQKDASGASKPGATKEKRKISSSGCVYGGIVMAEGTVADVSKLGKGDLEAGKTPGDRKSPDLEVCLDPGSKLDNKYDVKWDNKRNVKSKQDLGGSWYDLDDQSVQGYIRNNFNPSDHEDSQKRIESFMRDNPNPKHEKYNPTGGNTKPSIAMEDDCGNDRFSKGDIGCEDPAGDSSSSENLFYSFFETVFQ